MAFDLEQLTCFGKLIAILMEFAEFF